jgi:multiple sugar transport system substrate-binding protein
MNLIRWEDYYQKVPAAVYSGRGPDVGIMHIDQLATYAALNVILPLDDVASALGLKEEDFAPVVWKGGIYNRQRYGIPLDMHPLGFYYNKGVMEQAGLDPNNPPGDRDEYRDALEQMRSQGIMGSWVSPFLFTGGLMFQSLVPQFGGSLYESDGSRAAFDSEAGVAALSWLVDLVKEGHSPRNVGQDADNSAFMNGDNAFIWNGPWIIGLYASNPALEWGVTPLPKIGTKRGAWGNSHNFVIMNQRNPDSNKLAAAKAFISWMSDHSIDWATAGMVPARAQVRASKEFRKLEEQQQFAKEIPYMALPPPVPGIPDAQEVVERAVNEAILLVKTPREALDDAAKLANDLLAENLQRYGA